MKIDMDDGSDIAVDMGPLIDCVFLLLIFFLVSSTMKKPNIEIPIDLPEDAISAQQSANHSATVLAIDKLGQFFVDGLPVGQSELHRRLKTFGEINPNAHLRIDVDKDSPSRALVQVLDLCTFEGLKNYTLNTRVGGVDDYDVD